MVGIINFVLCCFIFSNTIADNVTFRGHQNLQPKPKLKPWEQGPLTEDDVMTGLQSLFRSFIPNENNEGFQGELPMLPHINNTGMGNKYTNVNFVLYNKGIRFHKQDDSNNVNEHKKMKFNCVLIVASSNKCYGWDLGQKHGGNNTNSNATQKEHKISNDLRESLKELVAKAAEYPVERSHMAAKTKHNGHPMSSPTLTRPQPTRPQPSRPQLNRPQPSRPQSNRPQTSRPNLDHRLEPDTKHYVHPKPVPGGMRPSIMPNSIYLDDHKATESKTYFYPLSAPPVIQPSIRTPPLNPRRFFMDDEDDFSGPPAFNIYL